MTSAVSLPAMCGGEIIPVLVTIGLFLWGRSVADKHGTRGFRLASWMPIAAIVVHHLGIGGTVIGLVMSFGAVESVPASERAMALSDGIATAMWSTAIGLAVSALLYLASVITFTVGTLRAPPPERALRDADA